MVKQGETIANSGTGSALCRRAAEIIKTNGWSQGSHARDTEGRPIRVTSPDAASFSAYGAIMRAMWADGLVTTGDHAIRTACPELWRVLCEQARAALGAPSEPGPIFAFNDHHKRKQAEVEAYLLDCADILENIEMA